MPPDGSLKEALDQSFTTDAQGFMHVRDPHPEFTPASTPPIYVDRASRQVLSLEPEADRFYGLLPGTNGTGPAMRRACVPADFTWLASDMKQARGVLLVPSDQSDELNTNPWSGKP